MKTPSDALPPDVNDLLAHERQRAPVDAATAARLASRLETTLGLVLPQAHAAALREVPASNQAGAGLSNARWLLAKPLAAASLFGVGAIFGAAIAWGVSSGARDSADLSTRPRSSTAEPVDAVPPVSGRTPSSAASRPARDELPSVPLAGGGAAPVPESRPAIVDPLPTGQNPPINAAPSATLAPVVPRTPTDAPAAIGGAAQLRAEQLLVDQARSALARDRPADALVALDAHRRRYSTGQLREECASLNVVALARLGRNFQAHAAAKQFHARYPNSLFSAMVDAAVSPLR